MPDIDVNYMVETDAGDLAVGAALMQHDHPVAFVLKWLKSAKHNYNTADYEPFRNCACMPRWCPYLDVKKPIMVTDCKPLIGIHTAPNLNKR